MATASRTLRARRATKLTKPKPKTTTALAGRISLFRGKVRGKPLSVTMTPHHWALLDGARDRLSVTRADVIALLIEQYARTVRIPATLQD